MLSPFPAQLGALLEKRGSPLGTSGRRAGTVSAREAACLGVLGIMQYGLDHGLDGWNLMRGYIFVHELPVFGLD